MRSVLVLTLLISTMLHFSFSQNSSACHPNASDTDMLHIAFFTAVSGSFVSSGAIPAVDLAIELINNNTSLLQGYTLNYTSVREIVVS